MESLLAGELRGLGAEHVKQARAGVSFQGALETAYRVCLWSRLAGRVLLPLATGPAADGDELYADRLARGLGRPPGRGRHPGRRLHRHQRHDPRHAATAPCA